MSCKLKLPNSTELKLQPLQFTRKIGQIWVRIFVTKTVEGGCWISLREYRRPYGRMGLITTQRQKIFIRPNPFPIFFIWYSWLTKMYAYDWPSNTDSRKGNHWTSFSQMGKKYHLTFGTFWLAEELGPFYRFSGWIRAP